MKTKPVIMGILNTTPDSFSDGGSYVTIEQALAQVEKMINSGAKIIDVGGESTRPGAEYVDATTEIKRVVPIIKAIKAQYQIDVSVDTYKSEVAIAALEAGADIVNDVWGNKYDGKMLDVICQYRVPYIWMHNQKEAVYGNLFNDIKHQFMDIYRQLAERNYPLEHLYFDPGVGFAKNGAQNLEIMSNLAEFTDLPAKILLGTSRKSVYNYTLGIKVAQERDFVTAYTTFDAVLNGIDIIRVHNVELNQTALELAWQMMGAKHDRN